MGGLNTNTMIGILVVLGFILFFGWMIVWMARSTKQQKQERADMAAMLGFQPVLKPDFVTLKSRLAHINPKHGSNSKELRDVFVKHLPEGDLYLYDLWDTSGRFIKCDSKPGTGACCYRKTIPTLCDLCQVIHAGDAGTIGQ